MRPRHGFEDDFHNCIADKSSANLGPVDDARRAAAIKLLRE
jgi:hypothetical protein